MVLLSVWLHSTLFVQLLSPLCRVSRMLLLVLLIELFTISTTSTIPSSSYSCHHISIIMSLNFQYHKFLPILVLIKCCENIDTRKFHQNWFVQKKLHYIKENEQYQYFAPILLENCPVSNKPTLVHPSQHISSLMNRVHFKDLQN